MSSPERGGEGKGEGEGGGGKYVDDLFEPFSPVNSPDHLFDLSDEEGKRVSQVFALKRTFTLPLPPLFASLPQSSTAAMGYPVEELSDEVYTNYTLLSFQCLLYSVAGDCFRRW